VDLLVACDPDPLHLVAGNFDFLMADKLILSDLGLCDDKFLVVCDLDPLVFYVLKLLDPCSVDGFCLMLDHCSWF